MVDVTRLVHRRFYFIVIKGQPEPVPARWHEDKMSFATVDCIVLIDVGRVAAVGHEITASDHPVVAGVYRVQLDGERLVAKLNRDGLWSLFGTGSDRPNLVVGEYLGPLEPKGAS